MARSERKTFWTENAEFSHRLLRSLVFIYDNVQASSLDHDPGHNLY